jgi:probable HAF family extracellular repeat protein
MKSSRILGLFALVLGYALVSTAAAPSVTFTYKNVKISGATEVDTYGLNDAGVIVGDYLDSSDVQHGMMLNGTKLTTINDKACSTTTGTDGISFYGINSAGTAVGWCTSESTDDFIGLMYSKGKITQIAYPKAVDTEATGINDKGDVVGAFIDTAGAEHGFLMQGKKFTEIDAPSPDTTSVAWDINNKGQITVYAYNSADSLVGFVLTGKKFTSIADPNEGTDGTVVHALDNTGDVDGTYYDSSGDVHGFLYTGGKYYTLNDPTGCKCDTRADGMNDKLLIVGRYSTTLGGASIGYEATTKK